jgi:malonyl CoA-acyl carrier protein transacylase
MKMEPQVIVITRSPTSRVASLLREAGYLVTKVMPELADQHTEAEALIVDLRWFDLVQWLDGRTNDDRILVIGPNTMLKGITTRTVRATDVEDDLVSAVDRIVADQRTAAYRREQMSLVPGPLTVSETPYSPLTSFFGAMAR